MKRVTFGVAASSFAANMSVKQNAINLSSQFPLAAAAVDDSFYVDDCLCGADTVSDAIELQSQLQEMFEQGGFTLRKWNSSDLTVLENVPFDLKDVKSSLPIASPEEYTKTLGIASFPRSRGKYFRKLFRIRLRRIEWQALRG